MKNKEFNSLRKGDKVTHRRYGKMTVVHFMPYFGPMLIADDKSGCELLSTDSGTPFGTPFLESSPREIQIVIEIKWYAPENTNATATLKQHCFQPVHWVGRYMNADEGYLANGMLCGGGAIGEDYDHRSPWAEVDAEPFNKDHACKKCVMAYRKLFGKEPS